jgi:transposase
VETNATRMCALLVGLPELIVLAVEDQPAQPIRVHVEQRLDRPNCAGCGAAAWVKERPIVELVDPTCTVVSWTGQVPAIAASRLAMTDRAGRWATGQVGRNGRTVNEVAAELGCDWHTVNDAVVACGTALVEDPDRIGAVTAVGLDEVLFARQGRWRTRAWSTTIADVATGQLLDIIDGRLRHRRVPVVRNPAARVVRADRLGGPGPVRPVAAHLRHRAALGDPGRGPVPPGQAGQPASR